MWEKNQKANKTFLYIKNHVILLHYTCWTYSRSIHGQIFIITHSYLLREEMQIPAFIQRVFGYLLYLESIRGLFISDINAILSSGRAISCHRSRCDPSGPRRCPGQGGGDASSAPGSQPEHLPSPVPEIQTPCLYPLFRRLGERSAKEL